MIPTLSPPALPTPCHVLNTQSHWLFLNARLMLVSFLCLSCSFARRFPLPSPPGKLLFFLVFLLILYFGIISELDINCKISTKNSWIPFTQIPKMLTFYYICVILLLSLSLSLAPKTIVFWTTWESVSDMMSFYCKYFRLYSLKKTRTFSYITVIQI